MSSLKSSICCLLSLLCMFDPNGFLPTCCTDLEVRLPVMNIYDCKRLCRKLRQCSVAIGVRRMAFLHRSLAGCRKNSLRLLQQMKKTSWVYDHFCSFNCNLKPTSSRETFSHCKQLFSCIINHKLSGCCKLLII